MKKNEVILFKQYDSNDRLTGRSCFHTAFANSALKNTKTAPRQSIEARAFCFFPDHTPNTCPPIDSSVKGKSSNSGDKKNAEKKENKEKKNQAGNDKGN